MRSTGDRPFAAAVSFSLKYAVYRGGCGDLGGLVMLPCCLHVERASTASATLCPSGPSTRHGGPLGLDGGVSPDLLGKLERR